MLQQSFRAVTRLFLQQVCPLCDRPTPQEICPLCWQKLQSCASHQPPRSTSAALPLLAWGVYQGALKQAIAALKYDGNPQLATPLGHALGHHWRKFPISTQRPPLVVPIPLHTDKLQERGFNQADLLAISFCAQTGLTLVKHGLIRQRATAPQFGLGVKDRQQNLAGAFALGKTFQQQLPAAPVLLLDDIYTTGTTVRNAAAALRRHQISVCGVVAIAQAALDH